MIAAIATTTHFLSSTSSTTTTTTKATNRTCQYQQQLLLVTKHVQSRNVTKPHAFVASSIAVAIMMMMTMMMMLSFTTLSSVTTIHAYVVVPSTQQQQRIQHHQQQYPLSNSRATTTTTATTTTSQLYERKRTKGSSSNSGGFGNVVKDIMKSTNTFPYTGTIRPGKLSPQRVVLDETIMKPDYWETGIPSKSKSKSMLLPWMIEIKTSDEIMKMKQSGILARHILDMAGRLVRPGITTDEIDTAVYNEIIKNGAYPSPLNYHGYPKSCCTSVNEVICHGIPDDRPLQVGDIINLDITVYLNGYHGDCSEMFVVTAENDSEIDDKTKSLLQTTYDCWIAACSIVYPNREYKEIGKIIEDYVVPRGYTTVRNFCGHGIGSTFHTTPNILHYTNNEPNGIMTPGHTFTIEPMICEGSAARPLTWPDDWTATTCDGSRSAQFEHTLLVTEDGVEALTGKNENSPIQFWERESQIHKGIWLGTSAAAVQRQKEINQAAGLL